MVAEWRVGIDAEVRAGDILDRLGSAAERLERMEDTGSETRLSERPQGAATLGATEMDGSLSGRRTERFDHVGCQREDDVVGNGEDRQVGQVDGGRRALAGLGAQLVRQVADVFGVATADRGDRVAGRVKGAPQRRSGAAGSDDGDGRLLHGSVSVPAIQAGTSNITRNGEVVLLAGGREHASGGEAQVLFGAPQTGRGRFREHAACPPTDLSRNGRGVYAGRCRADLILAGPPVEHVEGCADLSRVRALRGRWLQAAGRDLRPAVV